MLQLYSSFIRPHLEYATSAWDTFLKKDIELIENVQKFALRVCTKSWDANYSGLLVATHLPSLQTRTHTKLCNLFKIINGLTFYPDAPTQDGQQPYPSRSVAPRPPVSKTGPLFRPLDMVMVVKINVVMVVQYYYIRYIRSN